MVNINFLHFELNYLKSFLTDIEKEWNNQDNKFPNQVHTLQEWLSIILEEFGEIAKEINEIKHLDLSNLNKELIQTITLLIRLRYSVFQCKQTNKFQIIK